MQSYKLLQPQQDQIEQVKQEVATLRSMLTQHSTPSPLKSKLIASTHSKHMQVLSIVGDGRCLFYSLLQTQRAMLPLATEADDLRRQLRAHLLSSYTDDEWIERVPVHMRDTLTRQRFAERYLTESTAHVPIDVVSIWQDMTQFKTDVYLLDRTWQGTGWVEKVECVPCRVPATNAIVLLLIWNGVGHYEVATYNGIITLPCSHEFIRHLDALHRRQVEALHNKEQRRAVKRKRTTEEQAEVEVVE